MNIFQRFDRLISTLKDTLEKGERRIVRAPGKMQGGEQFKPGQAVDEGYRAPAPKSQAEHRGAPMKGAAPEKGQLLFGVSHQKFRPRLTTKEGDTKFEPSESVIHVLHSDGKAFGHALVNHTPSGPHVEHLMLNDEHIRPEFKQFVHDTVKKHVKEYTKSPEFKEHTKAYHDSIAQNWENAPGMATSQGVKGEPEKGKANAAPEVKGERQLHEKPGQARPAEKKSSDSARQESTLRAGIERQKEIKDMVRRSSGGMSGVTVEGSEKKKI